MPLPNVRLLLYAVTFDEMSPFVVFETVSSITVYVLSAFNVKKKSLSEKSLYLLAFVLHSKTPLSHRLPLSSFM